MRARDHAKAILNSGLCLYNQYGGGASSAEFCCDSFD